VADLVYISLTIAFFVLCVLYVRWCDRIIGDDPAGELTGEHESIPAVVTDSPS
jgi:hypothetical protein